jgi:nicotinamidase-related amidase
MGNRDWQQFALLLIDVQEDFWNQELEQAFPEFRDNISRTEAFSGLTHFNEIMSF